MNDKTATKLKVKKEIIFKSLLVKIFQWLYLVLGALALTSPVWLKLIAGSKVDSLPTALLISFALVTTFYCLILSSSFFTQQSTILILALVLIFFTTIAALLLLGFSVFNVKSAFHGLPACTNDLKNCSAKDTVIIFSFLGFITSVPVLILNILTISAAIKALAARA